MKFNKIFPEKKNSGIFENCRRRVGIHGGGRLRLEK